MQLTPEQQLSLAEGEFVTVDVGTTRCIVVREDVFNSVQKSAECDHEELRAIFTRSVASSDWNDREMDVYDNHESR